MGSMLKLALNNLVETETFAEKLAALLQPILAERAVFVGLDGQLGAGKTTFVAKLARALGSADPVSSPSYVLEHQYLGSTTRIFHWDLYRLTADGIPEELLEPRSAGELILVEWSARLPEPAKFFDLVLAFSVISEHARSCEIHSHQPWDLTALAS